MLAAGLITLLNADDTLKELVSKRIYQDVLPRGYVLPAIVVHTYGGSQEYVYAGLAGIGEGQAQLDFYAATPSARDQVGKAIHAVLDEYVGTLEDGTNVSACYLERDMDMPFHANADSKGMSFRGLLGYRLVTTDTVPLQPQAQERAQPWGMRTLTGVADGVNRVFVSDARLTVPTTMIHINGLFTRDWILGPDGKTITTGPDSPAPTEIEVMG